jgi:hypothetical protein
MGTAVARPLGRRQWWAALGPVVTDVHRHRHSGHGGGAHWLEAEDRLAQGTFDRRVVDIGPLAPQAGPGFAGGLAVYAIDRGSPAGKACAAGSLMSGTKRTATHLSTGVLSQGTGRPSPGERAT